MKFLICVTLFLCLASCNSCTTVEKESESSQEWVESPEPTRWGSRVDTDKPNILVLGDSISMGYTGPLIDIIGKEYDVRHPRDNCRNSYYTLSNLDWWLAEFRDNSVITWNVGLWDAVLPSEITPGKPREWYTTSLEEYEKNLIEIARKLKGTGARVIFLTTTDIISSGSTFEIGKEHKLNEIAKRVLPPEGVEVHDLYALAASIPNAHVQHFDVHFKNSVYIKMAEFIAKIVRASPRSEKTISPL